MEKSTIRKVLVDMDDVSYTQCALGMAPEGIIMFSKVKVLDVRG